MSSVSVADAAAAALAVQQTGTRVSVVLHICDGAPASRMLVFEDGRATGSLGLTALDEAARDVAEESRTTGKALSRVVTFDDVSHTLYVETHSPVERLVVVGAGHIAVPLAALGVMLDFDVTVLDDRPEFAEEERFADGVRVMRADFVANPFADVAIDERTYITLVTRGHMWDFDCLTRLMHLPVRPRYIGMIGSKRRVRAAYEALDAAGVDRMMLGRIHAPIGLDINADTPEEIALSIAAEIVAVRRNVEIPPQRTVPSRRERERIVEQLSPQSELVQ